MKPPNPTVPSKASTLNPFLSLAVTVTGKGTFTRCGDAMASH
jgi:hypothetical protein